MVNGDDFTMFLIKERSESTLRFFVFTVLSFLPFHRKNALLQTNNWVYSYFIVKNLIKSEIFSDKQIPTKLEEKLVVSDKDEECKKGSIEILSFSCGNKFQYYMYLFSLNLYGSYL